MSFVNGIVKDNEEEELIDMIEFELRKIHLTTEKLLNNMSLTESNDPVEKRMIEANCLGSFMLENGFSNEINETKDPVKLLEDSLQNEIDYLMTDIGNVLSKMKEYNEMVNRTNSCVSNLNEMIEISKNQTNPAPNFNNVSKNIKQRFRKERAELKTIISTLFAENYDIQDLIARILEHHLAEGADKYFQLENTDSITEQIELLRRTNLFEINPNDPLQIRLTDLV